MWQFPIKSIFYMPDEKGAFGAIRKFDTHTGIDIYCDDGTLIYAVEDGIVKSVNDFTGKAVDMPWWNDTKAVLVEGKSGVVCYGEINPKVNVGEQIKTDDLIGNVARVLKKDKGRPTSMLHLELYKHGTYEHIEWTLNEEKPDELLDPTPYLLEALKNEQTNYSYWRRNI